MLDGGAGYSLHGLLGTIIVPVVALLLLAVSFRARVPGGVKWALFALAGYTGRRSAVAGSGHPAVGAPPVGAT